MKDWVGKRFGRVVVLEYAGKESGRHMWRCRCDCGREFTANQSKTISQANTSGVRGVYFNKRRGKWIAQIMFEGK